MYLSKLYQTLPAIFELAILETMQDLRNEPIQFVFIGDGLQLDLFKQQVKMLELNNTTFITYQDKSILPYSLTACDLSLVTVASGVEHLIALSKFYSALAAGKPIAVVCPPHSYLNQLVADSQCGIAVKNGDSTRLTNFIDQLRNNPDLADRIGRASRQYLELHFTPTIIAQQYINVLTQSLNDQT